MGFLKSLKLKRHKKTIDASSSRPQPTDAVAPALAFSDEARKTLDSNQEDGSQDLWETAYAELEKSNKDLVVKYERRLSEEMVADSVKGQPHKALADIAQAKLKDFKAAHPEESLVQRSLKVVNSVKGFVSLAANQEPHAAIAWTGVLLHPHEQRQDAIKILEAMTDVLVRYASYEENLSIKGGPRVSDLQRQLRLGIIKVYKLILELQARAVCQFSRNEVYQYTRDIFKTDDWPGLQTAIHDQDLVCDKILTEIGRSTHRRDRILKQLPHARDAAYNSVPAGLEPCRTCLPGTRYEILDSVKDWASANSGKPVFWLRGMAGTGKSTIARTVAKDLDGSGKLIASFCFRRGHADLAHSQKLITTIAYQLAFKDPDYCQMVGAALDSEPSLEFTELSNQYNKLILEPLRRRAKSAPSPELVYVVLDALDECYERNETSTFLRTLGRTPDLTELPVRVFITSREEPHILDGFGAVTGLNKEQLILHQIDRAALSRDIRLFFDHALSEIRDKRELPKEWPGEPQVEILVQKAEGLFIYAETVRRYVDVHPRDIATKRLRQICENTTKSTRLTASLDETYGLVLKGSIPDLEQDELQEILHKCREIIGSLVLLFDGLSALELGLLLFPAEEKPDIFVKDTITPLRAVFDIPDDVSKPIRILHQSFRDFILDVDRCSDERFQINTKNGHLLLLESCLKLMSTHLKQNICALESPGTYVSEIAENVLDRALSPSIRYACQYWVDHALESGSEVFEDEEIVHVFLQKYLLFWLEAMSLVGRMSVAAQNIQRLSSYLSSKADIYSSGLRFSPSESIVLDMFQHLAPTQVLVLGSRSAQWSMYLQILEGHTRDVRSVAFSPDGLFLASASSDATVRLWDAETGECCKTLQCDNSAFSSVAFSPDGRSIISASYDTAIRLWDIETSECYKTLRGHNDNVLSVAVSPDGLLIASASVDRTVRLWDAKTGESLRTLEGHNWGVNSVAFSLDGHSIASGSGDGTVRLWDAKTGESYKTLDSHTHHTDGVTFSPDRSLVAATCTDSTVRLWDSKTGEKFKTLKCDTRITGNVVFSPDGSLIASASYDGKVWLWTTKTGKSYGTLKGHTQAINSLAFSLNGSLVASASNDKTVRLWDVKRGNTSHLNSNRQSSCVRLLAFSPDGALVVSTSIGYVVRLWEVTTGDSRVLAIHTSQVNSIVFSPNGLNIATASEDGMVRVQNIKTGECRTLEGHTGSISEAAFSPDGDSVVSGAEDYTVRIWNVETGEGRILGSYTRELKCVAFSPDGALVASGSHDRTIQLWEVETGQSRILKGHSSMVTSVAFSPDGSLVASIDLCDTLRLWDTNTDKSREIEYHGPPSVSWRIEFDAEVTAVTAEGAVMKVPFPNSVNGDVAIDTDGDTAKSAAAPAIRLDETGEWTQISGKSVLWLPVERRGIWVRSKDTVAIGSESGLVTIVRTR